jgi:glycosyltransferase involved in cell wall biosynthesis
VSAYDLSYTRPVSVSTAGGRRIGYVIGQLTRGGAERQLYELLRGIDTNNFRPIVYCLSEKTEPFGDLIKEMGVELRVLRQRCHFDVARIRELVSLLRRDRIEILHSFLFKANAYAWPAQLLSGVPHLITSVRSCNTELGFLQRWVNRLAFRSSDVVICNGHAVRSFVARRFGVPIDKSIVIHNGIDLRRFETSLEPGVTNGLPSNAEDKVVITVARLVPEKDLQLFIEAAKLVTNEYANVRFLIVGDGPRRSELMRYASDNALDRTIFFLGERDDVPRLLANADVFWLTSKWEGLPNVVLEAMASGKPVIAREVGACSELIDHGETGFLVQDRDAKQFARYTLDLLTNPALSREMGAAGKAFARKEFSTARMIQATEALSRSLLQPQLARIS